MSRPHSLSLLSFTALLLFVWAFIGPGPVSAQEQTSSAAQEIEVSIPDTSGSVGDQVDIEVRTSDLSGKDVIGYQFILTYDGSVLNVTGVDVTGTLTPNTPTTNTNETGEIRVSFADTKKLSGSGVLLKLEADVVGSGTSPLSFESFKFENPSAEEVASTTSVGDFTTTADSASVDADGQVEFSGTGVRINFSGVSGSDEVQVAKYDLPPSGTDGISESNVSSYRFVIKAGSQLSFGSNTEVRFDVGSLAGISDPNNVTIYERPNSGSGTFSSLQTTYDSGANELLVTTDSFSEFVMASNSEPLPVEIVGFEARKTDRGTVRLRWQTASETKNAGFAVQRATSPPEWSRIGFVEGQGTTSKSTTYQFTDQGVPYEAASVRYRLKQVDTDGTTHVGPTVTVDLGAPERVSLGPPFPNPTSGSATVRYAVPKKQRLILRVVDVLGRQVKTLVRGTRQGRFERQVSTTDLPSGVYLVQLRSEDVVKTRRLTVIH